MSKKVLLYCLKVWLTSVLLGPILLYCWSYSSLAPVLDFFDFTFLAILMGFALSIPSALAFWGGIVYLRRSHRSVFVQKLLLGGWTALLVLIPFKLLLIKADDRTWLDWVKFPLCYWLILLAGIYSYRFPRIDPGA